ncbi:toxin-antitoxin system YwqK family antitoxin [Ulvibacterium marinum]|uniref:toxin-antitoxin system YwqK family antitoxin n=1 Tax=Ulvibacterium marinum TaxID=2419782 RepID=UPI0024958AC9|nr:hypothetical protein [Ulvibacterium marinum]
MKFYFHTLVVAFFLLYPNKNPQRKIISDSEFSYTFYVSPKETNVKNSRHYYWYKSGEIHSSQGGSSGNLLHGEFTKSYKNNNLAEKGSFKNGLKNSIWKRWFKNGQLYEIAYWKNGLRSGDYVQFSENGQVSIEGRYKNNRKHGIWINVPTRDTLHYKKGTKLESPKKTLVKRVGGFFKDVFSKKEKDSLQNNQVPTQKKSKPPKPKKKKALKGKKDKTQKQGKLKEQL